MPPQIDVKKIKSMKTDAPLKGGPARSLLDTLGVAGAHRVANRVASQQALTELSQGTKLDIEELREIRDDFASHVDENNELNMSAFCAVMTMAFPTLTDSGKLETLFTSFDTDKSGTIDFKEFTMGISKLTKGSVHDKLELLFEVSHAVVAVVALCPLHAAVRLAHGWSCPRCPCGLQCCDEDGDGVVSIEEVLKFVHSSKEDLLEATQFTEELVRTLDKDGDGNISLEEFSAVVGEQPILYVTPSTRWVLAGATAACGVV